METEERYYDPELVAKIIESRTQFEEGEFKVIGIEDLWK
jgi:response regulator RpfG family c-di-GMP phosphodiesterase